MAIENVTVKDASGNSQPISADKIGSDYVQVVKLGVGGDGAFALVDNANPIPTNTTNGATAAKQDDAQAALDAIAVSARSTATDADAILLATQSIDSKTPALIGGNFPVAVRETIAANASGNITTQNLVPAGAATANSAVEITLNGACTLSIQTTGTYTGALSLQGTINGTTWVTFGDIPLLNVNTGGYLATITSGLQSIFQADVTGFLKARITGLAAMTGTAAVTLQASSAPAMVALDAALPAGANAIGTVTAAQATAASLKAQVQQIAATATDKSGTITTGGTAQAAIALNANRRAFYIQNLSAGDLWFSDTTTAVAASPSIKIPAGGLYESMPGNCPTAAISIIGDTTGQAFAAREIT